MASEAQKAYQGPRQGFIGGHTQLSWHSLPKAAGSVGFRVTSRVTCPEADAVNAQLDKMGPSVVPAGVDGLASGSGFISAVFFGLGSRLNLKFVGLPYRHVEFGLWGLGFKGLCIARPSLGSLMPAFL